MPESNETRHIEGEPSPLSVPDGTLQPGQVLQSRYRILGVIGMGGMGAVYQARDLNFPTVTKLVAVKEMINLAQDQQLRETTIKNFQREAEILATLSHPSIPQIYDYFSFGDRAYLVMEFIQGKDLEAILNSTEEFLPVPQVRDWAVEICNVLSYLHNHQPEPIIFRDMKPSNVMIDHLRRVRLIDFGIAKTFQNLPGTMIGTDGYAAPEAYKGLASPSSDIYCLGATLHHLLTRCDPRLEPPFSFNKRPIRQYNPNVPEALAQVVMRALSYNPEERYASAEAMRQSIEATIDGGIIERPPIKPDDGSEKPERQQQEPVRVDTGPTPREGIIKPDFIDAAWKFKVEDAVRSRPLVRDGVVYASSYDNNLWALDSKDGSLLWKSATEGGLGASPAYSGGTIFIGSTDQRLHAIDSRNGSRKWTFKTEGKIFSTACAAVGLIFFGSDDGKLYALKSSATSAREVWSYNCMMPIRSSPVVEDDAIFFGTDGGEFTCLDVSGELRWRFQTRRRVTSTCLVNEGFVYVGSDDWYMYALDLAQGYPNWRYRTRGLVISSPAYTDRLIYFGSADGALYALDALSGHEAWKFDTGAAVTSSPAVYRDAVYVGSANGIFYCLHAKTGELLWQFQSQGPILSSPVIADDMVYVGSDDHHVYALQA